MSRIHRAAIITLFAAEAMAVIPLPSSPSWTSNDNDYSTGGAFAFIDTNRFIDLCTSNGNDMAQNRNGIYLNNGGTLETVASWRSSDQGYFGHCYAGDVNNDGRPDLAVAYLGPTGELVTRIYFNTGNGLATSPGWKAKDRHSSFDCCLGDFDLDGDLDLAISAGDAYSGQTDSARIYRNNAGVFDTLPCWTAREGTASDAVRFCDVDNDGDLDLFVGQRRRISMYRNNSGTLETSPSWVARQGVGWILRLAFGDYNNDGYQDMAAASNGQLGDQNSIRVYRNRGGTLDTVAAFTMLSSRRYSSCVAWGDVNGDGWTDLAAGGWWEPAVVFENQAGNLQTSAGWSWIPTNSQDLVCEALVWGDVGNLHLVARVDSFTGDGQRRLFTLSRQPVQVLDSITVDGVAVPSSGFCSDPLGAWFSLANVPGTGTPIRCHYRYPAFPDLAVTNWVAARGNHLFRNTTPTGISADPRAPGPGGRTPTLSAWPNPFRGAANISFSGPALTPDPGSRTPVLRIYDASGRCIRTLGAASVVWDGRNEAGARVPPGIYLCAEEKTGARIKLVRLAD